MALTVAGDSDEAVAASQCLLAAADATDNPHMACFALLAYGFAQTATPIPPPRTKPSAGA